MTTSETGMTFNELEGDVRRYLERGFSAATDPLVYEQIPRLITLAERRCAVDLKIQGFLVVTAATMQAGVSVYPKPDRWRMTVSINFGIGANNNKRTPMFPRSYEYIRNYWQDESETSQPKFYADYNYNNWLFGPTPDESYPYEAIYYELPALLSTTNQTNWLTQYAPQMLLYATLLEATPFLKNDERMQLWQSLYSDSKNAINQEDLRKIVDRSTVRTGA